MSKITTKLRYTLQFYFDKGVTPTEAHTEICAVYGQDCISKATVTRWFIRFRKGNFNVRDAPRSGRPRTKKANDILAKVKQDRHISSYDIGKALKINHRTVLINLEKAGYKKKLNVWVPHNLTRNNLLDRISICESLLKRNEIEPFLDRLITSDEKWITYYDYVQKKSRSKQGEAPRFVTKPRKIMLCVWWDCKGIVHYELLPPGETINSDLYCQQLARLHLVIQKKRPELVNSKGVVYHLQPDNTGSHTSLTTRQKLRELGWEVLMHPPYSPDLAPSDYHLFRFLTYSLKGVTLPSKEACEDHVVKLFNKKSRQYYNTGIMVLPKKWQKVIEQNGAYVTS
ncbi:histone-lysine N-methyltransferase SETMAR-like [Harpegnathos saltator]|uniref:histone-lysine N-methyltransferase SETMAR-like n=1 Tax=Harpegnathos saltator TaxID=610380 RepID=UPI000590CE9B|nr:histone-lysine N-methyltransferase SETMAR-like [Harpegnathos saltator]XP_019697524.1 histone-lysine N-methyltransferase SETMAR-like [Harpegnathos saltator]